MKRKYWAALVAIAMLSVTWAGSTVSAQEITVKESEEKDAEIQEGYTEEGDGYTSVVTWCKNGDKNIYGKFYFPEGYDESKAYPTVIMSHGLGSRAEMVERALWPQRAVQEGYVVYAFDFCGGGRNSNSDGDYMEMSVMTEVDDLNAVMDFVKGQPFVDGEHLFLLGQSQGGLVSALTAAERADEVEAMVLIYPAFCIVDDLHEFIPDINEVTGDTVETAMGTLGANYARDIYDMDIMKEISGYNGEVMIIHGEEDKTVPYTYSEEAIETAYGNGDSEFVLITGEKTAHGFEMINEEARDYAQRTAMEFLNNHKQVQDPLMVTDEGYVIEGDGYQAVVTWCDNGETKLFGRMYYPEDFDENSSCTTVVMNHGKSINCDFWYKAYAPALARAGYVCYTFDCRSCTEGGRGCFSDLLPEGEETRVSTYSQDLNQVLDFVEEKEFVDLEHLYLFGQSMGGMTVQNVAAQRQDEIAGVIVLYGAIGDATASLMDGYEELKAAPYSNGEVLFILGALEGEDAIQNTLQNLEWYEENSFMLVSGAGHGFGYTLDRPAQICIDTVTDFIERTSAGETP